LYSRSPCHAVADASQLPASGAPYLFVVRQAHLEQLYPVLGRVRPVAQGDWVHDKTGILPRMLRLAKGVEPLERIAIVSVGGDELQYASRH
jgi:hypothetical protein